MQSQARLRLTSWFRNPFKCTNRKRSKSKHVVYVGQSAQNGFVLKKDEVNHLHALLEKSGITEEQLTDPAFVIDIIQNVMD